MNAVRLLRRIVVMMILLSALCGCQRTLFESAPAAAAACDPALVGRWLSLGERKDETGELEALVDARCGLVMTEHERDGDKRSDATLLRNVHSGGVKYLWVDAAWANRSFEVDPTLLDRSGDIYLFAYRLRRDTLELAAPPHRALAHRVLDKDIPGEVLMQGDDLAVRVAGDSAALRKILATHRLFHFEQPLRFRRAKADEAP